MPNRLLKPQSVQSIYLSLTLLSTLSASFIWGINTLFLLDAGLTNAQAFAANAFFTAGQVIFEVPTGLLADSFGRRTSYLLGTITLSLSTILYFFAWQAHASFIFWVITSILLGLGFTFFSGATEAWLVDALSFTRFKGTLDSVFAKGQMVGGIAMLLGSVSGGLIAQSTNLGVPYLLRAFVLFITFLVAFTLMKDLGFKPDKNTKALRQIRNILGTSVKLGLKNPPVRWVMLASFFSTGVSFYAFYAMQPHLLNLYGDQKAYLVAGLGASLIAGSQILGGLTATRLTRLFRHRTTILLINIILSAAVLAGIGLTSNFYLAIFLLIIWGLTFSSTLPVRQSYLNGLIPSKERATVLSFDSLVGSSGGVAIQPALGKIADVSGYPFSYLVSAGFQIAALPLILLARSENPKSDILKK